jgi:hypothetical protein
MPTNIKEQLRAEGWVPVPDVARALGVSTTTVLRWTETYREGSEHEPVATAPAIRSKLVNGTRRYAWLTDVVERVGRNRCVTVGLIAANERLSRQAPDLSA